MEMTAEVAAQREADNAQYRKLNEIEDRLRALVTQAPSRYEMRALASAYNTQTGGDVIAELASIQGSVKTLTNRYPDAKGFAYKLLSDAAYGRDWNF